MSRRTRANAERVVVEVSNSKSSAPTRIAVRVPQRATHAYAKTKYFYGDAGADPNKPGAKLIQCQSRRLSRAQREVKFMHGVKLYKQVEGSYQLA